MLQTSEKQLNQGKHQICRTSEKTKSAANIQKPALPWQTSDMSNNRKTKKCCKHAKTSLTRANIRYFEHPKNEKVMQISENQLYQGEHPICQTSEKTKSAANIQKSALPWQTSDMSNNRKTKKCCKHAKTSLTRANIRYFEHPKNEKVMQISENQLYQGEHPICQTSEKPKSAENIRRPALPGQTLDMSNIRKTKKCCKQAKTSLTRANIKYFEHPKNEKVLQTSENQLYQGKHQICQTSEKTKVLQTSEKQLFQRKHPICQTSEKKQKVLQTSKKQLFQGKHPICQTSEKRKSAANKRKPA